jgi:hypothetical protein
VLAVLIILVGILVVALKKRPPSYFSRQYLFTKSEWHFYHFLAEATCERWLVMGKPRIADVLSVNKKLTKSDWMRAFSKISSKHVDYIVLNPDSGIIVACIELDDKSHQRKDRKERDVFVNAAFEEAGIPLLRYPTADKYDVHEIHSDVVNAETERMKQPGLKDNLH